MPLRAGGVSAGDEDDENTYRNIPFDDISAIGGGDGCQSIESMAFHSGIDVLFPMKSII